jgi:hypothetical protein
MKLFSHKFKKILIAFITVISFSFVFGTDFGNEPDVIIQQIRLEGNNVRAWMINTGIWNQDLRYSSAPGFEWPAGTNKFAVFTTGLCIGAYVNGQLREAMASYKGEYAPGYIIDSAGYPIARADSRFKFYSVKRSENWINNPDWLNWGLMVPFGAPFIDVNSNGSYEPMIDTPGIRGAEQTIYICITDGFPERHSVAEGFGGGTLPLYAEMHFTAWAYNTPQLQDVQFLRWEIFNKSRSSWNNTFFSIFSDNDLGYPLDDYNGCDTSRRLGYTYNGDDEDNPNWPYSYGLNPPAIGMMILEGAINRSINPNKQLGMSSFIYIASTSSPGPACEKDAVGEPLAAYNYMRGFKKDLTPWVVPNTSPPRTTKYCYPGDPETLSGWTEFSGSIQNCGGILTGNYLPVNPVGNKTFVISSGAENFTVAPGEKQVFVIAQFIARGSSNVNSVTRLKQLADNVMSFYNTTIGITSISNNVPAKFNLFQNYPNPFNPVTTIRFDIPFVKSEWLKVKIVVYDILGKQVAELMNEEVSPGTYKVNWDASNYPSGVYFYNLSTTGYSYKKKRVVIK